MGCTSTAPTSEELTQLAHTIAHRVGRFLERQGLLERDMEHSYLASDAVDDDPMTSLQGHSITYRIAIGPQAGRKVFTLQTLPASVEPFDDGTTHVIYEQLDFIARLAALVPKPRVNLTRFHGVFAPNSKHRALVTPAERGKGSKAKVSDEPQTPTERRAAMTGFCSCKTGIPSIHGHNLDATPQAGVQY